ncbi:MAG: DUF2268 domain-containing putative Zn-dependent protease [Mycobacterium leprae]
MAVRVRNIVPDFVKFFAAAAGKSPAEKRQVWRERYQEPNRDLFDVYYRKWGDPQYLDDALAKFPAVFGQICSLDVGRSTDHAVAGCRRLFRSPEPELDYVAMVGLFCSNGWATVVNGVPTAFFALELLPAQSHLDVLVAHETAHAVHHQLQAKEWSAKSVAIGLLEEGLASFSSSLLCPGLTPHDYFWFGFPRFPDWVEQCEAEWPAIRAGLLEALDEAKPGTYQAFFTGGAGGGLPARCGYYAGYRIVADLYQNHSLAEMARWSEGEATVAVQGTLWRMEGT